jgi:membrane protease YdiL (CAAX protease family)
MANRTIVIQSGKALILLGVFVLLSFGLPMGLRALGAGRWVDSQGSGAGAFLYSFIVCGLVLIVAITVALRRTGLPGALLELGVLPFGVRGILIALLSVATMIAVVLVSGRALHATATAPIVTRDTVGPFAEEILFRGFLFRQLRRWAGIAFWIAAVLSSLVFAYGHLYQGHTLLTSLEAAGVTFGGGILFCWLTERWGNLWPAIVVHAGLDLVWMVFQLGDNAVGDLVANVARLAALAVAIAGTLIFARVRQTLTPLPDK